MKQIYFVLGIHNHQPVGNFPEVFEMAYKKSYLPFTKAMFEHPKVRWSLHCTGVLWDFILREHPEYIEMVSKMVGLGQVELLTGGYYEPIISVISDEDKRGQILKQTAFLKKIFGVEAKGMWLAERVWEPSLAKNLAQAGIKYTVVDDAHFAAAGMDPASLKGYYVTEDQGVSLNIFPISQLLRYYIPFKPVDDTIRFFGENSEENGSQVLVMADDGEKFGLWPETYKHVYQNKWLEHFLEALEQNSSWIRTITFSDYMKQFSPAGRVYLPTSSYFEMSEWSLPTPSQEAFEGIIRSQDEHSEIKRFLRGGFWRNFLSKYPESNNMHKKMLYVSDQLSDAIAKGTAGLEGARDALYAGQCNCAYWHGVFGGLYLPHLRTAVYRELLTAESMLRSQAQGIPRWIEKDFDVDGANEVLFEGKNQNLYFSPQRGGCLFEWDLLDSKINFLNTLTRRREAYHKRLREYIANPDSSKGAVKTIHDLIKVKEANLDKYLTYDWYRRESFVDHFLRPDTSFEDFAKCQYGEQGDFVGTPYEYGFDSVLTLSRQGRVWINDRAFGIRLSKTITPRDTQVKARYILENLEDSPARISFAPEFNFAFSYFEEKNSAELSRVREWSYKDEVFGVNLKVQLSEDARVWVFPVQTVSLSESGFEKTYQGTAVVPIFELELPAHGKHEIEISLKPHKH